MKTQDIRNQLRQKAQSQAKRADDFIKAFDWDFRKSEYLGLVDTLIHPAKAGASIQGDYPI
jgi:hypothetical protein